VGSGDGMGERGECVVAERECVKGRGREEYSDERIYRG